MFFFSRFGEFNKIFGHCLNDLGVKLFINMRHFIVINIQSYHTLPLIYYAVCYAYIIWIDIEPMILRFAEPSNDLRKIVALITECLAND